PGVAPPRWTWSAPWRRPSEANGDFSLLARFSWVELGAELPPSAAVLPGCASLPGAAEFEVGAEPLGLNAIRPAMVSPDNAAAPAIAASLLPRLPSGRRSSS